MESMANEHLRFHRKSIRLKEYDYSQPGAYFVTLNTHARDCIFGEIQCETMVLSRIGEIVKIVWELLPNYFPIRLDEGGIMPNHFHGIIVIDGSDPRFAAGIGKGEAGGNDSRFPQLTPFPPASPLRPNGVDVRKCERPAGTAPQSLGAIIQTFKSMTTRRINALQRTSGGIVWQRIYYEHVIRNEIEWENIRLYIQVNPTHWAEDDQNPSTLMR
jgi:putative transposase